jgi:hypothetical protein
MRNMVIPPESWNELMTHHLIWNEAVPQAKTSLKLSLSLSLCKFVNIGLLIVHNNLFC